MFNFSINKVNFEEEIGEGAHGTVYAYQQKNPGEEKYAVKRITASKIDVILSSVQEIVLGFSCDHPHVLPIKGYHIAYEKTTKLWNIFIKMSRMETSLKKHIEQYIKEGKIFIEEEIVKYFYALTLGLRYLHNKSIAHRDIKPDNILIDNQGQIKIADIGTGKLIENEENDYLSCAVGIPLYTAPEVLTQASKIKKKGLFKADIWSLGVIMAELCVPKLRLVNTNATGQANEANLAQILKGLEGRYKKVLLDLIASLLRADPNERQSLEAVQRILEENYSDILAVKLNYEFGVMKQDMDNKIAIMKEENEKLKIELLEIQEQNREIKTLLEASLVDIENNLTPMKEENQRLKTQLEKMQEQIEELMTQSEVSSIDAENKLALMKEKNEKLKTKLLKLQQENIRKGKPQSEVSPVPENSKKLGLVQQSPPLSEEKVIKKEGIFKWFRKDSKQQPEEKKSEEKMLEFRDHIGNVSCLEILSTGELASGGYDKTIKLWNIKTGACIKTLNGHKEWISCLKLLPKGELASSSWDDTIKIWNTKKCLCIITLPGHAYAVSSLEILSTGELISSAYDKTIKLWDLKTGLSQTKYQYEFSSTPLCLKSLPTGEVACGLWDHTIMILDLKRSKLPFSLMGHENPVTSLALLLTGELASSSEDLSIRIWNIKTRICRMTLLGHNSRVNCVLVLPTGELASGSADQTIKIWDIKSGICTKTFQGPASIKCLDLLPSGELISGTDNIIKVWNLKDEGQSKP